ARTGCAPPRRATDPDTTDPGAGPLTGPLADPWPVRRARPVAGPPGVAQLVAPIDGLRRRPGERPAGEGQAEGLEQAVAVVALGDRRRDHGGTRRRRGHAVAA